MKDIGDGSDHVIEALVRSDRMGAVDLSAPRVQAALDAMGRHISEGGDRGVIARLRRRNTVIGGVVAAALLAVGTPAAAQWVGLHTGLFGSADSTENDSSEFLDTGSPELGPYLDKLATKYPLPPGGSFEETKSNAARNRAHVQRAGLEGMIASSAQCQWMRWWLDGHTAGDRGKLTAAAKALKEVPTWPILHEIDGGGVVASAREVAHAAETGDATLIRQDWTANCVSGADHTDADLRTGSKRKGDK